MHQDVFCFDISMHNAKSMEVTNAIYNLNRNKSSHSLAEKLQRLSQITKCSPVTVLEE